MGRPIQADQSVWFDLDNSPHVPLFVPIIQELRARGIDVLVTAREHSQTVDLLHLYGMTATFDVVGRHYGGGKFNKLKGTFLRAAELVRHVRKTGKQIAVAVSHGSRSMVLAARWLNVPVITMYDYEYTETTIFNRLSDIVLTPDALPENVLDKIGVPKRKRRRHEGLKEEVYIRRFSFDPDLRESFLNESGLKLADDSVLVAVRPPATTANYHDPKAEKILRAVLRHIAICDRATAVIAPRTREQAAEIEDLTGQERLPQDRFVILAKAVNGLDLAFASDLLISGGGTMNREAALLGVSVYSIFSGRLGSVDAQMEHDGLITFVRSESEVGKIKLVRRDRLATRPPVISDRVERFVIEQINSFLQTT